MEILNAGYAIIEQRPGIEGIYAQAELPGRICYGSQDKIAPGTAEIFCKGLMKSNHGAPLEHNGVYLDCPQDIYMKYVNNPYSKTSYHKTSKKVIKITEAGEEGNAYGHYTGWPYEVDEVKYYVSTNLRVLFEKGWLNDLQYICEPTPFHEKRITVSFIVDRFTGEEYLRHRKASFNRESTRYVNFVKDKFGKGSIKFIKPVWIEDDIKPITDRDFRWLCQAVNIGLDDEWTDVTYWLFALKAAEFSYNNLINKGWAPEQARTVLPCAINSPLIKTAFVSDWCHFFNLRAIGTTGRPHPQAKQLAEPLMNDFIERGLIKIVDGVCGCQ